MFGNRCLLVPPFPGRAGQLLFVSPDGGSLLLRHIGFPCPRALGCLPRAGCVGFPPLGCLRCRERIGSVGFTIPSFPGSFDVLRLSGRQWASTAALHLPVLPRSYHAAGVSLLPTPGHLYLDLTARSWSRMLRGWQAHLPGWGKVISQVPKRLSPACSSTPILLPQECCECRSFLPACAPAGLQRGNSVLALSVLRLQCGASSHWFSLLRLWAGLADRCSGPTRVQL